jgi:hypothetical protein
MCFYPDSSCLSVIFFRFFLGPLIAYLARTGAGSQKMKILSREKFKVLAEKNGWSLARAEGFVDGESFRRRGKRPPNYVLIGIDEYCQGFRAGYFERRAAVSLKSPPASAKM